MLKGAFWKKLFFSFPTEQLLFQSVHKILGILGFFSSQSHQKYPINARTLSVYLWYWLDIILFYMHLSQNAHNFVGYFDLIFWISALFLNTMFFTVFMFNVEKLFQILDMCEKIIDRSKSIDMSWIINDILSLWNISGLKNSASPTFCDEIDQRFEKWSEIVYFSLMKVTPAVAFVPKILVSIYVCLAINSWENDALELSFPMW